MKKLVIHNIISSVILAVTSIFSQSALAYVPNLFGAYEQGAQMARQANTRDGYYYGQMSRPQFYFEVWENGKTKPKRNLNLSLKKGDNLCWGVYNVPFADGTVLYASELFTMPYHGGFTGASPNEKNQKITAQQQVQTNAIGFDKQIFIKNGEASSCWIFHPTATPKGTYSLKIGVGNTEFGTRQFNVVN